MFAEIEFDGDGFVGFAFGGALDYLQFPGGEGGGIVGGDDLGGGEVFECLEDRVSLLLAGPA